MRTASVRFAFKRDRYEVGFYAEPHAGIVQTTSGSEVRGPTHRTVKAKSMQCTRVLTGGGIEHAAALSSADQAGRQRSLAQRSAKHARDMRPALTPIEARTAIHALATARSIELNAGGVQHNLTRLSDLRRSGAEPRAVSPATSPEQGVVARRASRFFNHLRMLTATSR